MSGSPLIVNETPRVAEKPRLRPALVEGSLGFQETLHKFLSYSRVRNYSERTLELASWPVKVTSYALDGVYHATVDNVSPGAWIARADGATQAEAESKALAIAQERLVKTRRTTA